MKELPVIPVICIVIGIVIIAVVLFRYNIFSKLIGSAANRLPLILVVCFFVAIAAFLFIKKDVINAPAVKGVVMLGKEPLSGAKIKIYPINNPRGLSRQATTDNNGRFHMLKGEKFSDFSSGANSSYVLEVSYLSNGSVNEYLEVFEPAGESRSFKIDFGNVSDVEGILMDRNNKPVESDYIVFNSQGGTYLTHSDKDGLYKVKLNAGQKCTVSVSKPGQGFESLKEVPGIVLDANQKEETNFIIKTDFEIHYPYIREYSKVSKVIVAKFGDRVPLSVDVVGGNSKDIFTYQWNSVEGSIEGTGNKVIWNAPNKPGAYTVNVRISDDAGNVIEHDFKIEVKGLTGDLP